MLCAYFDCQFGAAGDMLLGAMIDAGLDLKTWEKQLNTMSLPEDSFKIKISQVKRASIAATKFDVIVKHEHTHTHEHNADGEHKHAHSHEHTHDEHSHEHSHSHEHTHDEHGHEHTHDHGHTRKLDEVLQIIASSKISAKAKALSNRIFQRLAQAEGLVHGVSPNEVHFHEVGAVDAIVDIVGFAIAYDLLGIEQSYVSAVPLGAGQVRTAHGLFPIPAPAVVRLLQETQAKTSNLHIQYECLTPTGAAILCEIATAWGTTPSFQKIQGSGFGAGSKDPADMPNVCRVLIGVKSYTSLESQSSFSEETIVQLEANIDDLSPQILAYTADMLYLNGALDVSFISALMKKGRPGHIVSVICQPEDKLKLQEIILRQTSTLGVRAQTLTRIVSEREWQEIELEGQPIRIKIARDHQGNILNAQPEFEDCAAYARHSGKPLKDVMNEATASYILQNKTVLSRRQAEKI
ncbi:MAG: nickel pincer cofactor biosynthesis protein LarC [Candidatus Obscuribacterales bacterium]|nr:nickel pincer cofactor biosynthesis protein LarC [Candidatus Obscuribacterales bacterium]